MGYELCSRYISKHLSLKKPEPRALLPTFLVCPPPPWLRKQSPPQEKLNGSCGAKAPWCWPHLPWLSWSLTPLPFAYVTHRLPVLAQVRGAPTAGLCTLRPCCHLCCHTLLPARMARGPSCSTVCGNPVPQPGIKPASPALQGGFLMTGRTTREVPTPAWLVPSPPSNFWGLECHLLLEISSGRYIWNCNTCPILCCPSVLYFSLLHLTTIYYIFYFFVSFVPRHSPQWTLPPGIHSLG